MASLRERSKYLVIFTLLVLGVIYSAHAEEAASSSSKADSPDAEKSEAEKQKAEKNFSFDLGYSVNTDLVSQLRPRLYSHTISAGASYDIKNIASLNAGIGYFFTTLDRSISRYPEDSGISYIDLGASRSLAKNFGHFLGADHSASASVNGSIPMTEDSQIEGYRGSIGISPSISSKFFSGIFTITNSVNYNQIFNKYRLSPVDSGATATASYGYSISSSLKILGNLSLGLGFGMRRTRYTDGFHDFSYNNSQSLSYSYKSARVLLSHVNGGYTDDGKVDFWYIDKYRRLITLAFGYGF